MVLHNEVFTKNFHKIFQPKETKKCIKYKTVILRERKEINETFLKVKLQKYMLNVYLKKTEIYVFGEMK